MSMTAMKVLERAEDLGMLDPKVIEELRRQVSDSKFSVSAEAIVKVLVDKKHLTQFQAKKLVSEVTTEPDPAPVSKPAPAGSKRSAAPIDEEDLLLLDDAPKAKAAAAAAAKADEDIVDLEAALPASEPLKAKVKPAVPKPVPSSKSPPSSPKGAPRAAPASDDDVVTLEPAEEPPKPIRPPPTPQPKGAPASAGLSPLGSGLSQVGPAPPQPVAPQPGLSPVGSQGLSPGPGLSLGGPQTLGAPGLSPLGMNEPQLGGSPLGTAQATQESKTKLAKNRKRGWDSPLLLLGSGGLGVLFILFLVLYLALTVGSAQELYEEANEKYRTGAYATAVSLYQKFLGKYPDDPNASAARVKIGMAQLRQDYDGAQEMGRALKTAQQVLPQIESEENFDDARAELESMLPAIADNFATNAKTATDLKRMEQQVELAHEALKLVNNASYLPSSRRTNQAARIDSIMEKIRVAERTINQDKALASAMEELQANLKSGDIVAAYQAREKLLQEYPTLEKNPDVVKNTLSISQRERDLVSTSPASQAAATDDPASAHPQVVLASRSGETLNVPADATAFVLVRDAVYAVEAASGKIRWRRYLGQGSRIRPLPLTGGDVLVAEESRREVLRLAGATGKVVWRQTLEDAFFAPQQSGEFLYITLASGRVARVNAATGEMDRAAQLPQKAAVAAGVDTRGKLLYQPGEHSTLFALAADDSAGEPLACQLAYYLGHSPGSIVVPPVAVVGYVFVFENTGVDSCLVHALTRGEKGAMERVREPFSLRGRITVPPSSASRRLIVVTDLGDTMVIDVDPGNTASPVNVTAQMVGGLSQPTLGYHALSGSQLFIADHRLAEYEIVATRQSLDRGKSSFDGDAFLGPLQMFGTTLVHVRQRQGANSVLVTGVSLADNKSWQVSLGAGLPGVYAFAEQKQFAAISSDGNLYEVPLDSFQGGLRDKPSGSAGGSFAQTYTQPIALPEGRWLFPERAGRKWLTYEGKPGAGVKRVDVQTPDPISAQPAAFAGGVLAPLASGSIWLLDAATGAPLSGATPFQPPTEPDAKIKWLPPVVVDDRQFIAVDSSRRVVFLARREDKPQPFLAESRRVDLDFEPAHAALVSKTLLLVARGPNEDEIVPFNLPSLERGTPVKLGARVGPGGLEAAGEGAFCTASSGELLRITPAGEIAWRAKVEGPLAGVPISSGSDWIVVDSRGGVSRIQGDSGEVKPVASAGQPITGGVKLFGSRLVAGGADGVLHILPAEAK